MVTCKCFKNWRYKTFYFLRFLKIYLNISQDMLTLSQEPILRPDFEFAFGLFEITINIKENI